MGSENVKMENFTVMLVRRHHPRRLEVSADGVEKRNVGDASFSVRRGNSDKGGKGRSDMKEKTYNGRQSIVQRERERKKIDT